MPGSKPKLYYFAGRGRAELIRLVFAASNTDFDDIRYSREDWPKHKSEAPTGVLPYVDSCGDKGPLVQSGAIARFFAKKAGMMGANDWEFYLIERAMSQVDDVFQELIKIMFAPEDKKADLKKEFQGEKGQRLLSNQVKFLKEGGDAGFYAGKSISLADLASITLVDNLAGMADFLAKFPELCEHKKRVLAANAKLADYIKNRPETPM